MNAECFLAHYEQIADAPDAIARLRRFVLDLAMRGKLVPQSASDEPASELLKQIAKAKERLLEAGEMKVRNTSERVRKEPVALNCPTGWVLTDLGVVSLKITDGAHRTPTYVEKGVPFISVKDFSGGKLDLSKTRFIPEVEHRVLYQRCDPRRGDILIGRIGTLGKAVLVDTDAEFSLFVSVGLIRFDDQSIDPTFFRFLLNSPFVEAEFNRIKIGGGTHTNKLNLGDLHTVAFPLPPLAEQNRIVAKLDELMGLCDRLEAGRESREAARDRLAAASLACLNAPDPETFQTDARFALGVLPALTTRPDQIKQLRQTILNLAVRGKLMPQSATDEPICELLSRIATEKVRLVGNGSIPHRRVVRDLTRMTDALPGSWSPIALGDVCDLITSGSRGWGEFYATSGPSFIRAQNIRFGKLRFDDLAFVNPPRKSEGSRTQVAKGDLLVVITGAGVTNPALLDHDRGEAYVSQHVGLVRPSDLRLSAWLLLCLMADAGGRAELVERAYGAGKPGLNLDNLRSLSIPLAPLAEQHRIVAKVDALMALCDRLEASLTATAATRRQLLHALLAEALTPVDARELEAAE
ncbi:MAG: hsdS [Bradyrhizobium sp.]|nr:hsdS [Bradyrhizobium sp.]